MKIGELKKALVEVKTICAERNNCDGCPFERDMKKIHLCKLAPQPESTLPEKWLIDDWKEDK